MFTLGFMIAFLLIQFHAPWYDYLIALIVMIIDSTYIFGEKIWG